MQYFSNAPTLAGRMAVTPTVACTPPNPFDCVIFGFHQSASKGVDLTDAITNKAAAGAMETCWDCENKLIEEGATTIHHQKGLD